MENQVISEVTQDLSDVLIGQSPGMIDGTMAEVALETLGEITYHAISSHDTRSRDEVKDRTLFLLNQLEEPETRSYSAFYAGMLAGFVLLLRTDEEVGLDEAAWQSLHPVEKVIGASSRVLDRIYHRPLARSFLADLTRDEELNKSKTTIAEHLKKLGKLGCVSIAGVGRSQSLALTSLGRRFVDEYHPQIHVQLESEAEETPLMLLNALLSKAQEPNSNSAKSLSSWLGAGAVVVRPFSESFPDVESEVLLFEEDVPEEIPTPVTTSGQRPDSYPMWKDGKKTFLTHEYLERLIKEGHTGILCRRYTPGYPSYRATHARQSSEVANS